MFIVAVTGEVFGSRVRSDAGNSSKGVRMKIALALRRLRM
jgi:hypothetical protein